MILVDTSVWIEALRDNSSAGAKKISKLLEEGLVVISGMILLELLQGTRSKKEYNLLLGRLKIIPVVNPDDRTWIKASRLSFILRLKGVNIDHTMDIVIAALAIQNRFKIYTFDKHFELISKYSKLNLIH